MDRKKLLSFIGSILLTMLTILPISMAAEGDKDIIPVGELAIGFSENALQPSYDLVGKSFVLHMADGTQVKHDVINKEILAWEVLTGDGKGDKGVSEYMATNPRPEIYFVDFLVFDGTTKSVSVIVDFKRKIATGIFGFLPTEQETSIPIWIRAQKKMRLSPVTVSIWHASLDAPFASSTARHQTTNDLIGKRVQYNYSARDAYEHIYLNDHLFTWHCIAGNEKGQADTELCNYYKIAENLYLFTWQEKIVPTLGVVLVDLDPKVMKTTGKLFGYAGTDYGKVINFPVGAYAKVLSDTKFDYSKLQK